MCRKTRAGNGVSDAQVREIARELTKRDERDEDRDDGNVYSTVLHDLYEGVSKD